MNPNNCNYVADHAGTLGCPSWKTSTGQADFIKRVKTFERRMPSSPGMASILHVAEAALFRKIPLVEAAVIAEQKEQFENRSAPMGVALRPYLRTLRVLRRALSASVTLESSARSEGPLTIEQDRS